MSDKNNIEEQAKLLAAIHRAIQRDGELREQYQIGDRFRFVKDRLRALADELEQSANQRLAYKAKNLKELAADEVIVYVYLYNTQGLQFRTWQNLVTAKVFYEYSVNRPIYSDKSHIEALLRTKSNSAQHAFLSIAVKADQLIKLPLETAPKDVAGNPVIKVKEGSLRFEKLLTFTHQDQEYRLNEEGNLVKVL